MSSVTIGTIVKRTTELHDNDADTGIVRELEDAPYGVTRALVAWGFAGDYTDYASRVGVDLLTVVGAAPNTLAYSRNPRTDPIPAGVCHVCGSDDEHERCPEGA